MLVLLIQLEHRHECLRGHLDGAEAAHLLLGFPRGPFYWARAGALFSFNLLGRTEFALRRGFACGKTLVRRKRRPAVRGGRQAEAAC